MWEKVEHKKKKGSIYPKKINIIQNKKIRFLLVIIISGIYIYFPQLNVKAETINLYGNATSSNRIMLYWSGTTQAPEYIIERKYIGGSYGIAATIDSGTSSWIDLSLIPNAQYVYRIKVTNRDNETFYSNEVIISNTFLEAPSSLTYNVNSDLDQELSWVDNSINEQGFEIWRRSYNSFGSSGYITSSSYSLYTTVGRNVTSFVDANAQPGMQYSYMVRAFDEEYNLYSTFSNSAIGGKGIITPPDKLTLGTVTDTQVKLTWRDNSSNENGFRVERRVGLDGEWEEVASLVANTTSFYNVGLVPYTQYFYRIKAYTYSYSSSSYSNELSVNIGKPYTPENLKLEAISSTQINISWKDSSSNEKGFKIERKRSGESRYRVVATLEPGSQEYADKGLKPDTRYYYKVKAFNISGTTESKPADTFTKKMVTFDDLDSVSWAREAIESLSSMGIIKGKTINQFYPNDNITRAEFTSLLIRAFNLGMPAVGPFGDVKYGKWYYNDVTAAKNLGIVSGDDKSLFYPDEFISREDMAVILKKTLNTIGKQLQAFNNSVLEKFIDKNMISPYALSSIASLYGEGILSSRTTTSIAPKSSASRAEAAVILYNAMH